MGFHQLNAIVKGRPTSQASLCTKRGHGDPTNEHEANYGCGWYLQPLLVGGLPTPLQNDGVKVSWDDDYSLWKNKIHDPNHQPEFGKTL